jgi:hypothetical protein
LEEDISIPNGEIILSEEELEETEEVLYSEDGFKIVELSVNDPFDILWDLTEGESFIGEGVEMEMLDHRPEMRFGDDREGRVFESRPQTEIHAVFAVELPSGLEDEYYAVVDDLEYQIQRANEPYYDIAKCEYHYFDHHFRGKAKADPEILVFAETRIEFTVGDDNSTSVVIPEQVVEQTFVSILPQRPYGSREGWRLDLADEDLEEIGDGRLRFVRQFDLEGIDRAYIILFVGDEIFGFKDHFPSSQGSPSGPVNTRYQLFDEYDQRNKLSDYLQGDTPDVFEIAVLNILTTAGYHVQWFGESDFNIPNWSRESEGLPYDEVDMVAHLPDNSQVLFVECTNKRISEKESILDRTEEIASVIREEPEDLSEIDLFESSSRKIVPVIATSLMPDELSDQVVAELTDKGIVVLDGQKLTEIYDLSADQETPVNIDIDREMWDLEVF